MPTKSEIVRYPIYGVSTSTSGQAALDSGFAPPGLLRFETFPNQFSGSDNRSWKAQIRAGVNATTNASGQKGVFNSSLGPQYYLFGYANTNPLPAFARRYSLCFVPSGMELIAPDVGLSGEANTRNQARTKFAKRVEKTLTQFSGGVFLAELREALMMIAKPGRALRSRVGSYLNEVLRKGPKMRRQPMSKRESWISDTWLEYSFGWAPLLNDLDDARTYLSRRMNVLLQELVHVSGAAESPLILTSESLRSQTSGFAQVRCYVRVRHKFSCVLSGAVSSRAYGPGLISASAMGLSPRSFVPTLWEVIPWSFAIDYFTNIGDVITGWSNQHAQLAWGRETLRAQRATDLTDQRAINTGLTKVENAIFIPSSIASTSTRFTRTRIDNPPVPGISFEIPGFGTKWVNISALIASRLRIGNLGLGR